MNSRFVAAAVQMNSSTDKRANLQRATELVEEAVGHDARLVALPEMFNCLGRFDDVVGQAEPIPGPTSDALSELASRLGIQLLAGSICEKSDETGKAYNTSLLFSARGELMARYRKMHLFDVDLPGRVTVRESRWIAPGDDIVAEKTPLGCLGMSICYDLRFPELYRRLADASADIIFVPAAFTEATGRDHWEILLRARAIENQVFVVAPNQCGVHSGELTTYGHSMIIDAWGNVLARADNDVSVITAELDFEQLRNVRAQLPALTHRRTSALPMRSG